MSLFVTDAYEVAFHKELHGILEGGASENLHFHAGKETEIPQPLTDHPSSMYFFDKSFRSGGKFVETHADSTSFLRRKC
jgi:hypothetical protein